MSSAMRAAIAMMVKAGLALPWVGRLLPPAIHRLGIANERPNAFTTP
jgi:hypothetical protein